MKTPRPVSGMWSRKTYIWHTLDLAPAARLYQVIVTWPPDKNGRSHREERIVAANRPMRAAELIAELYKEMPEESRPTCTGYALNIYVPKPVLDAIYEEESE